VLAVASLSILATSAVAAPPGGSSRNVAVNSTGASDGTITVTPVTAPGLAFFDVAVANNGKQTFTNASLTIGEDTASLGSASLPVAFDGGVTIDSFTATGFTCQADVTNTLLTCDLGNMAARSPEGSVSVVLNVPTATSLSIRAAVKGAERTNDGGSSSNIDTFVALSGSIAVGAETCQYKASYLKSAIQETRAFGTCPTLSSANPQSTTVRFPGSLITAIEVGEAPCSSAFTCIGQESLANLTATYSGIFEWEINTLLASKPDLSKLVISHYPDGSATADLSLLNIKKNYCKSATDARCIVEVSWDNQTSILTVVYRTLGNGRTRLS